MTTKQILEYNKRCSEFVVKEIITDFIDTQMDLIGSDALQFHLDWNWIMEVKDKICKLSLIDEFNTQYDSVAKGYNVNITPAYKDSFLGFYTETCETEKEAVVQAINQFLIWYKENK